MKTITTFLVLFLVTLCLQQAEAQSGRSYEEWLRESANGQRSVSKTNKPAKEKAAPANKKEETPSPAAAMAAPQGIFKGTIPCTDCQGITTELSLSGGTNGTARTYTMKQTYLGRPADKSVVTSSGKWFVAKGNKQDPEAVVLQLIPAQGNIDPMYFLQVSEAEVKLLSRQQAEIEGRQNYSLKKQ